jgi:dTDP-4-amino-4,6-dideoxygalactose transaminase
LAEALAEFFGVRGVVLTDSGTTALTLAIRALLREAGTDRVAIPGYSCYDLATAVRGAGARAVLYDLNPATLGPDWDSLGRALEAGVGAVVVAYLYGLPFDLRRVRAIADAAGVPVIEDAAQGVGASIGGKPLGSFGDLAVLSFGRGKGVTGGRGGALLALTEAGASAARREQLPGHRARGVMELVTLGAQALLARPSLYALPASLPFLGLGETVYRAPRPLRRESRVSAAVAEVNWAMREREIAVRRVNAERLVRAAEEGSWLRSYRPFEGAEAGWLRFPVLAPEDAAPRLRAARALGVMPAYPRALADLAPLPLAAEPVTPEARVLARRLWTLPTHSLLGEREVIALGTLLRG